MHPDIAESTIVRYCGRMAGNVNGGLHQLFTPRQIHNPPQEEASTPIGQPSSVSVTPIHTPHRRNTVDMPNTLRLRVIELHEEVDGDSFLMEHLLTEFNQTLGQLRRLKTERREGTVHPMTTTPVFQVVNDGMGFILARKKDFLEHSEMHVARRL